jgi:hypothetical protein
MFPQCYVCFCFSVTGKLYKSRVCFIKHLWEHTVYWDQFAGDKNHMRVLSIQAALILYGTCQQPTCQVPVDSLLVTSPHTSEHTESTPKKGAASSELPTTPVKQGTLNTMPATPVKNDAPPRSPETPPLKKGSFALKRKSVPKLNFSSALKRKARLDFTSALERAVPSKVKLGDFSDFSPSASSCSSVDSPLDIPSSMDTVDESGYRTPEKQGIPFVVPGAPKKKNRRHLLIGGDSVGWSCIERPRVSRCLVLAPTSASDSKCWKSTSNSKRKRAE